jgi:hypothetical protein
VLQVDADAALAEVVAQIGRADLAPVAIGDLRPRAAPRLAVDRMLDLHHVGAQVREQLGGERQRLHLLDREHAHTPSRGRAETALAHGAPRSDRTVSSGSGSWGQNVPRTVQYPTGF